MLERADDDAFVVALSQHGQHADTGVVPVPRRTDQVQEQRHLDRPEWAGTISTGRG